MKDCYWKIEIKIEFFLVLSTTKKLGTVFNAFTQYICRENYERNNRKFRSTTKRGGRSVVNLRYADVVLLAGHILELQVLVNSVVKKSEEERLYLNVSKTKLMKIKRGHETQHNQQK